MYIIYKGCVAPFATRFTATITATITATQKTLINQQLTSIVAVVAVVAVPSIRERNINRKIYCLLFIVYCLLFIVYCLLFIVYCLLFFVFSHIEAKPLQQLQQLSVINEFDGLLVTFGDGHHWQRIPVQVREWIAPALLLSEVVFEA